MLDAAVLGDDEPRDCLRSIRLREVLPIYVDDVGICEDRKESYKCRLEAEW